MGHQQWRDDGQRRPGQRGKLTRNIPTGILSCIGGVSERFKEAVLKTAASILGAVGSNPTPSATMRPGQLMSRRGVAL